MPEALIDLAPAAAPPARPASLTLAPPVIDVEPQHAPGIKEGFTLPFDPLRLVDAVFARRWLALGLGLLLGGGLGVLGVMHFQTHHIAVAQLIKQSAGNSLRQSEGGDPYQPHETSIPGMIALMWSSSMTEKASQRLNGSVSEEDIRAGLTITPERNSDIIRVAVNSDKDAATAVKALDAYISGVLEVVRHTQQEDAAEMNRLLQVQIEQTDKEVVLINEEILEFSKREGLVDPDKQTDALLGELSNHSLKYEGLRLDHETLDLKIDAIEKELAKTSPAAAKLQTAREELAQLQLRYTEEHPTVIEAAGRVKVLEDALQNETRSVDNPPKPGESTVAEALYLDLVQLRGQKQVLGEQLAKLAAVRSELTARLEQLPRKALELARIQSRKVALEASRSLLSARQREAALVEQNAREPFRLLSAAREQDVVVEKPTQKIAIVSAAGFFGGVGLIAGLSALFAAGDRRVLTASDLRRATKLSVIGTLREDCADDGHARDWAFRTWTNLHPALNATPDGTVVCGLLASDSTQMPRLLGEAAARRGAAVIVISRAPGEDSESLATAVLHPERLLQDPEQMPETPLHLHLDDTWTWTAAQRARWHAALKLWSAATNAVVLVELADPQRAETLLVAERLPNLLWIGHCGADEGRVREQATLFHAAGCHMIGAVLDHAPGFRLPLLDKLAATACLLLLGAAQLHAAEPVQLGPGDIVNIAVAGQPELERKGVTVAPDGTITYLQARSIPASGRTIDELRETLRQELARFYQNPVLMVTPNFFTSRKAYVLGKVVKKGAISLNRPMTLLELVAEAGGLETGLFQQNTVELADLGRSFLMRGNARVPVDMEALFFRGDMTQNVRVQPGDYLYFPSANNNEIYVLGDVRMQGTQGLLAHTSVHSSIAQAGGFTEKAYTRRVLVVRGALDKPETFVVNMDDVLSARTKGFRLEPKDIVYIADKPWARAEELLSFALNAFFQGAVSNWAGANVGPMIKSTVLPQLH